MNLELLNNAYKILKDAGFTFPPQPCTDSICIVDPTCVWPILLSFINTAWIVLTISTVVLLAGWGATMLRGAQHDMAKNLRTLVLIFGTLSVTMPILKVMGGEQLLIDQCNVIKLSTQEVGDLLELAEKSLKKIDYESFEITDSAYDDLKF